MSAFSRRDAAAWFACKQIKSNCYQIIASVHWCQWVSASIIITEDNDWETHTGCGALDADAPGKFHNRNLCNVACIGNDRVHHMANSQLRRSMPHIHNFPLQVYPFSRNFHATHLGLPVWRVRVGVGIEKCRLHIHIRLLCTSWTYLARLSNNTQLGKLPEKQRSRNKPQYISADDSKRCQIITSV